AQLHADQRYHPRAARDGGCTAAHRDTLEAWECSAAMVSDSLRDQWLCDIYGYWVAALLHPQRLPEPARPRRPANALGDRLDPGQCYCHADLLVPLHLE